MIRKEFESIAAESCNGKTCLLIIILALFIGCTGKPPEIMRVFQQINLINDREQNIIYQSLSLFVQASDPDGFEDIEEIYIINDSEELFWRIDSESWIKTGSGDEILIGSNSICIPDGSPLPKGEYRILLQDIGGDTAEQSFVLESTLSESLRYYIPEISIDKGEISVSGKADSYTLWIYDKNGQYLGSFPLHQNRILIQKILKTD